MSAQQAMHDSGDNRSMPLQGLATLMARAFAGDDLAPLGNVLLERVGRDPADADALMDLSVLLQLMGDPAVGLNVQEQALRQRQVYHIGPPAEAAALRLLAIKGPGEIMWNTPLEFLVSDADVALDILHVGPGLPWPSEVPEHDVLFVAVSQSERNEPLLKALELYLADWPRPVLNRPVAIIDLSRELVARCLRDCPGVRVPDLRRVARLTLQDVASGDSRIADLLDDGAFPVVARPVDSQAGRSFAKLDDPSAIRAYLAETPDEEFFLSPFVDYSGAGGLFRKYRIAMIQGRPFLCHMAVSEHWMIHYLNAGMAESAAKRAEEAEAMARFDREFATRHGPALAALDERIGLDYFGIDCAETPTGELLIFEASNAMIVHDMDPADLFPYKKPQMAKVFAAFRGMLAAAAGSRREAGNDGADS